jgi:hypothetical protein
MKVTQVELSNVGTPAHMVCWLPHTHGKLKVGMVVSLKEGQGMWKIEHVYSTQDHYEINRKWNVGGL